MRSMDAIREEAFEVRYLVLLDVFHILLSSFGLGIGSILLNDRINVPASDVSHDGYSTTSSMLQIISADHI